MKAAAAHRLAMCAGIVVVMAWLPQSAGAKATLDAHVVGATCTVTTHEGMTTVLPCSPDSWVVALQPNGSAQMVATIDYAYADDGLPLDRPQGITIQPHGGVRTVFYEAGALYVVTSRCSAGPICETGRGWEQYTGAGNFYPPVFISDNEIADSLSGTLTVTTGALNNANEYGLFLPRTWSPNIHVSLNSLSTLVFSGVEPTTPIPEPGTFVLMLLGLAALASSAVLRCSRRVPQSLIVQRCWHLRQQTSNVCLASFSDSTAKRP